MSSRARSGRTGYDASAQTQSPAQSLGSQKTQDDFTQSTMETGGVSTASDGGEDHAAIQRRAYEIYQESGCTEGCCEKNWAMAEQDLGKTPEGDK